MADYSYSEIMRMQNDAVRRVEEMQKRARETAGIAESTETAAGAQPDAHTAASGSFVQNTPYAKAESAKSEAQAAHPAIPFVPGAEIDGDKALILSLVLLLSQERADELLILALLYMLT